MEHEAALDRLIDAVRGKEEHFANLRKIVRPKSIHIYGDLYTQPPDEQAGIWLEPEQMQVLAACGIGWGLDILIEEPAREP